jgi:hypothetical protein
MILDVETFDFTDVISVVNNNSMFVFVLLSLVNSIIWGVCLGFPIYAVKRKFRSHAT